MRNVVYFLCSVVIAVCIGGCKPEAESLPVIDLGKEWPAQDIKLSEIASNVRLIPLQTTEEAMLGEIFLRVWVGEKYILTLDQKAIYQFDKEGRFIRKLAGKGKGPREFVTVRAYCIDENRDLLYYTNGKERDQLQVTDLKTGDFLEPVLLKSERPTVIACTEGGQFACCPYLADDNKYDFYTLSLANGEKINGFLADTARANDARWLLPTYMTAVGETFFYKVPVCDTLYKVEKGNRKPYLYVGMDQPMLKGENEGNMATIDYVTDRYISFQKQQMRKLPGKFFGVGVKDYKALPFYYLIDRKDNSCRRMARLYIDPLDTYYERIPLFTVSGGKIFCIMNMVKIKELIRTKQEAGEKISPELKRLDEQLTEEDNPVIIVGDV